MPRLPRKHSEADIYHVIVRGEGRKILFEDNEDRENFMRMLSASLDRYGASVFAWCLMSNHVHLLMKVPFHLLPRIMQSVTSGYAVYYNKRHDGVGHVFSGRYRSEPIDTDEYLLTALRYIHFNPVKEKLSPTCDYRWSSFGEYLSSSGLADTRFVLEMLGGLEQFERFHAVESHVASSEYLNHARSMGSRCADDEAADLAKSVLGEHALRNLASLKKGERDNGIALLRRAGITVKQIERLTGIGRGIVERVKWRE